MSSTLHRRHRVRSGDPRRSIGRGRFAAAILLPLTLAVPAQAGPVLDRVKATRTIHCGATERPGLLDRAEDGAMSGLLVDLCRAVGTAAAGSGVTVDAHAYYADETFDAVRKGSDDLFFLTGAEMVEQKLAGAILPGPPVFFETSAVMVPDGSPARGLADLAGAPVCFMQGEPAHHHLEAAFAARHLPFVRMGYQEPIEMDDAFDAGRCTAVAGAATELAAIRLDGGPTRRSARLLAEPLAATPILLATGTADARWSAVAAWTLATLQAVDRPTVDWTAGGLAALPLESAAPGLAPGWQSQVLAATGSYAAVLRRTVGEGSPLRLPAGPNASGARGGLMSAPTAD